ISEFVPGDPKASHCVISHDDVAAPWSGAEARGARPRSEPLGLPPVQRGLNQLRLDQVGDANEDDDHRRGDHELTAGLGAIAEACTWNTQRHVLLAMADVERRALASDAGAHPGLTQVHLDAG